MKTLLSAFGVVCVLFCVSSHVARAKDNAADGYAVGAMARDFSLRNIDGKMISLKSFSDAKGIIVVFTCNHCPFAKAYEDRIIALHKEFAPKGFPVIAINPNDPKASPEDSFEKMVQRSKEKAFPFPYIFDETQEIAKTYGATRTPHVYLLKKNADKFEVAYIGAIDDNSENAKAVKEKYVEAAIAALTEGKAPATNFTKAIGCTIKWKK
jgi:peroxiredoxin